RFDKDLAERAAKFIQLLPHTKGEWAFKRMPITLEPWQLFVICCAFGWVNKGTRLRRFREVYTEIPRKNGKSAISAGVALYCFALYTTMLTGMGARRQPLMWAITTAGYNIEGPCYDKRREVIEMLNGSVPNDELFGIIYTVDEGDDWTDPQVLEKANPNIGVSVYREFLLSQQQRA
ncbi:hypothetical protein H3289_25605, partial [Escherichia coli]|uniref:terminase large subunit domain-containing protein n=1 Tax=Escherichia coli TaxID=562 RepID=UPI001857783A